MSTPQTMVSEAELFALDGGNASAAGKLSLRRVVPVAPISEDNLLELATRAHWPEHALIARALADAVGERLNTSSRLTQQMMPNRGDLDGGWNLVSQRGITGHVSGFELLIGTRRFIEEAGIVIAEPVAHMLDGHDGQGWISVLVAARRRGSNPHEQHRSLIGILVFGSKVETLNPIDSCKHKTAIQSEPSERAWTQTSSMPLIWHRLFMFITHTRSRLWQWAALLVCASGLAGTLLSLIAVAPDEAVIVQRFGRGVACCGPGLHMRPFWPLETFVRIHPYRLRRVQIGLSFASTSVQEDPPIGELVLTGDMYDSSGPADQQTLNSTLPTKAKSASQLLQLCAEVQYVPSDIHAFVFGNCDLKALVATSSESVLRELIGSQSMMASLGPQRDALAVGGQKLLQERLDMLGCGVSIQAVILNDLQPAPGTATLNVTEAFNKVTQADADRADAIAQVQAEGSRLVSEAKAQAETIVAKAQADKERQIETARAQVDWVRTHRTAFREAPQHMCRQMLIDLIGETESGWRTIVLDPTLNDAVRLLLEIGEPARPLGLETIEKDALSKPMTPKGGGS